MEGKGGGEGRRGEERGEDETYVHQSCKAIGPMNQLLSTVHDTENLTFSEEFRGCSARNDADFPHGCRGTSARVDADLPCVRARIFRADGHESSVRIRFENGGNQKANFVRNNAKRSRNTPQGSFEISL